MSVAKELADYAVSLSFQDIPPDVIHQTKRVVLDTVGCAVGGYDSEARQAIEEYVKESGHPGEATVFGSGTRTSCLNATLVNGAMVRYLDYNDTAFIIQGEYGYAVFLDALVDLVGNNHVTVVIYSYSMGSVKLQG